MESWWSLFWVMVGGSAGAGSRYGIAILTKHWISPEFNIGTLIANLTGCFLIGLLIGSDLGAKFPAAKLAIGIGFLGSLTTFSTFSAETVDQLDQQQYLLAAGYVSISVTAGVLLTFFGIALSSGFRTQA